MSGPDSSVWMSSYPLDFLKVVSEHRFSKLLSQLLPLTSWDTQDSMQRKVLLSGSSTREKAFLDSIGLWERKLGRLGAMRDHANGV